MIERVLEPEVMDEADEAREYDMMDHSETNRKFVSDLLQVRAEPQDVLDIGTGSAQIPVELCSQTSTCRVMASDMSSEMLELARYHIEVHGMIERIQLDHSDAKQMLYEDGMFDVVMCNGMLHHIPDPVTVLSEAKRVTAIGGLLFFRDLLRPDTHEQVESLIDTYASEANETQQQMFRQSLCAAMNLDEMRAMVAELGLNPETVQMTSDRHWTWAAMKE